MHSGVSPQAIDVESVEVYSEVLKSLSEFAGFA